MPLRIPPCPPDCPKRRPACQGSCPTFAPYAEQLRKDKVAKQQFKASRSRWTHGNKQYMQQKERDKKNGKVRNKQP